MHNFTASCAGYTVATYAFGVCDRRNGNILVKSTGYLFNIDFGKFLSDAQMFGNFKRDRTPFVLTSDLTYVMDGGDKPNQKFQHFSDLCSQIWIRNHVSQAFNIVRQYRNNFSAAFASMLRIFFASVSTPLATFRKLCSPKNQRWNVEASSRYRTHGWGFASLLVNSIRFNFSQFDSAAFLMVP